MKEKVVIFGTGLFAEVVHYYFTNQSNYDVVAFTANGSHIRDKECSGLQVVPFEEVEGYFRPDEYKMFVAVGYAKLNKVRAKIYHEAKRKGYSLVTYICPGVRVWPNIEVGDNTFIFEDNTIQPFVRIGNNTVMWSGNHVGHHSQIGNHCFITSHVVISGNCQIGDYSFIGVNATLRDSISVGESCIIGAGSLIMKSTRDRELYVSERTYPDSSTTDDVTL
jgi:sugar O-acyltransferase (sialic acid O-acetyltransferase NeuD family)